ncbi:MAG: HAMP domain-containing histidine kinase [Gammaproteobacteria bacterium]|nr:HAMP domain-containing histidine kinase [Gammaproteobacteria bacterium]
MTIRRLKLLLLIFFIALALPTSILVYQAYGQLKWEAFHQHQQLARELSLRIDARFEALVKHEESRPFTEYSFFNISGDQQAAFLQRSPLSQYPLESDIPGLLGYFQVDTAGRLQTPGVPKANALGYGIDAEELKQRRDQENRLRRVLDQNRLVKRQTKSFENVIATEAEVASPTAIQALSLPAKAQPELLDEIAVYEAEEEPALSFFDSLNSPAKISSARSKSEQTSGTVADLELDDRYEVAAQLKESKQSEAGKKSVDRKSRKEKAVLAESLATELGKKDFAAPSDAVGLLSQQQVTRIRTFESEVDPLEFSLLDSGHFVLFRRVWNNGERYVQGLLFDQKEFVDNLIASAYYESTLASVSDLILSHQGNVVSLFGARISDAYSRSRLKGAELLYQTRLVAPFSDLELIFSLTDLPIGAGNQIILWSAFLLALVLVVGSLMLYRLGARQIGLAQQQQDFVSAVSHELKTPLTSIRMYGEMLREGWADETRKKTYYDYIFFESERLSRLINNVLQLARMTRRDDKADLSEHSVGDLIDELSTRLQSQLEQAGFVLELECASDCRQSSIKIDSDWFTQIMINLVDNAIKFSGNAEQKVVNLSCRRQQGRLVFVVRDYGPGIAKDQMKKVFKLFYRSENELTRETVGTGIGLSLVQQLVSAMGGEIDVLNRQPGVEFRISFAVVD